MIKDITVVRGYKKDSVNLSNLRHLDNDDFADTGELDSLQKAFRLLKSPSKDLLISYGDVLFNKYIPQALCQENDDFVIFVDSDWQNQSSYVRLGGFVECSLPNSKKGFNAKIYLRQLAFEQRPAQNSLLTTFPNMMRVLLKNLQQKGRSSLEKPI